jgi:vacuolar protein-sorting-associated protein 4
VKVNSGSFGSLFKSRALRLTCRRLIKQLFELAPEKKLSIIFIDEIDSLYGTRDGNSNQYLIGTKTKILAQIDNVRKENNRLFVLAVTNIPWFLDSAI